MLRARDKVRVAGGRMPGVKCQMLGGMERGVLRHVTKPLRVCDDTELNLWEDSGYNTQASVAHGEVLSHRASVRIAVRALPLRGAQSLR